MVGVTADGAVDPRDAKMFAVMERMFRVQDTKMEKRFGALGASLELRLGTKLSDAIDNQLQAMRVWRPTRSSQPLLARSRAVLWVWQSARGEACAAGRCRRPPSLAPGRLDVCDGRGQRPGVLEQGLVVGLCGRPCALTHLSRSFCSRACREALRLAAHALAPRKRVLTPIFAWDGESAVARGAKLMSPRCLRNADRRPRSLH